MMPGKILSGALPLACSRAIRFSRSSSLTRRARKRPSQNWLVRNSPSVRGRFMVQGPPNGTSRAYLTGLYADDFRRLERGLSHVAVAAGLGARSQRDAQLGDERVVIRDHGCDPLRFRAHGEQCLFEVKIQRNTGRELEGELRLLCVGLL